MASLAERMYVCVCVYELIYFHLSTMQFFTYTCRTFYMKPAAPLLSLLEYKPLNVCRTDRQTDSVSHKTAQTIDTHTHTHTHTLYCYAVLPFAYGCLDKQKSCVFMLCHRLAAEKLVWFCHPSPLPPPVRQFYSFLTPSNFQFNNFKI
jgi:hypothetical protein